MSNIVESLEAALGVPSSLAFALAAAAMSFAGVCLAVFNRKLATRLGDMTAILGGVILLSVSVLHLMPEALAMNPSSYLLAPAGMLLGWLLGRLAHIAPRANAEMALLLVPVLAIAIHSTLDGFVYVASLGHDHGGGAVTGVGLILHETPEGLLTYLLCAQAFQRRLSALVVALAAATMTTPLGAVIGLWLDHELGEVFVVSMYPVMAGLVLYAGGSLVVTRLVKFAPGRS